MCDTERTGEVMYGKGMFNIIKHLLNNLFLRISFFTLLLLKHFLDSCSNTQFGILYIPDSFLNAHKR